MPVLLGRSIFRVPRSFRGQGRKVNNWLGLSPFGRGLFAGVTPVAVDRSRRSPIPGSCRIRAQFGDGTAPPSGSQIEIALRLQLGDPHHAAALGGDKTRQQILQRDILRRHGVAASGEFQAGYGELNFLPAKVVWITDTENETRQPA